MRTAWTLLMMAWLTSPPLVATSPAPQQQGREVSERARSRAQEWKARRQQISQQIVPPKTSGLEQALLYLEGGGFDQTLTLRYKDLYPKFGQISPGSGTGFGLRYFKSAIGGSPLNFQTSAAFSFSGYPMADLHFGLFGKMAPHFFLGPGCLFNGSNP